MDQSLRLHLYIQYAVDQRAHHGWLYFPRFPLSTDPYFQKLKLSEKCYCLEIINIRVGFLFFWISIWLQKAFRTFVSPATTWPAEHTRYLGCTAYAHRKRYRKYANIHSWKLFLILAWKEEVFIIETMRNMEQLIAINNATCIQFRPRNASDIYFITFRNAPGCTAYVRMYIICNMNLIYKWSYVVVIEGRTIHRSEFYALCYIGISGMHHWPGYYAWIVTRTR